MTAWVAVCNANEIDEEDVVPFEHEGAQYAIYRSALDDFHATDGYCTHERELLCDGLVMGTTIECPKHNGRFDIRTGKAMGAPAIHDVATYPVKVDTGVIYIEL